MKVRAKRPHGNGYGTRWSKKKGDTYELPDEHAAPLIAQGLIEKEPPAKPARKTAPRKKPAAKPAVAPAGDAHEG
jgi:hypothetical protein